MTTSDTHEDCTHEDWIAQDSDRGASMVEYALLLALIAMAAIAAVSAFGGGLGSEFSDIGSSVQSNLDAR